MLGWLSVVQDGSSSWCEWLRWKIRGKFVIVNGHTDYELPQGYPGGWSCWQLDTEGWSSRARSRTSHWQSQLVQFSSVTQSCLTLCYPMDCTMPGFPVHHQLLQPTQTHVHPVGDAIQPSHPLSSPFSHLQSFPASGSFPMSPFDSGLCIESGGQSIGVSASASVLPMNIQDWFPLGWTGWISLQSKGLSRVFFTTTVQKCQIFGAQLSL